MSDLQWHAVSELETSMGIKVENPLETYCSACTMEMYNWKIIMFILNCTSCTRLHICFYSGNCSDSDEITGCKTRVKCFCRCSSICQRPPLCWVKQYWSLCFPSSLSLKGSCQTVWGLLEHPKHGEANWLQPYAFFIYSCFSSCNHQTHCTPLSFKKLLCCFNLSTPLSALFW